MQRAIGKGLLALVLVTFVGWSPAWAQDKAEITGYVGYMFGTSVTVLNGEVNLAGDLNFGGIVDINVRSGGQFELLYSHQPSELRFRSLAGVQTTLSNVGVNYFQAGGLYYVPRGPVSPFLSLTLGATLYSPSASSATLPDGRTLPLRDEWRFSGAFGLGVKASGRGRVGFRAQSNLWFTFIDSAGGMWCGLGGCSVGFGGTGIAQLSFTGGLFIKV